MKSLITQGVDPRTLLSLAISSRTALLFLNISLFMDKDELFELSSGKGGSRRLKMWTLDHVHNVSKRNFHRDSSRTRDGSWTGWPKWDGRPSWSLHHFLHLPPSVSLSVYSARSFRASSCMLIFSPVGHPLLQPLLIRRYSYIWWW